MRILLDECVNAGVCKAFPGHAVKTVAQSGWRSTDDGPLLIHPFDEVTLMLDGDKSGREGTERIAAQLEGKVKLSIVTVPDGNQPDQVSAGAIRALLETERQRPLNRQNLSTAESPSLRRTPDEARLEM